MTLNKIRFILDNCDVIEIDGKYIKNILIDNINKKFCQFSNSFEEIETCNLFFIEISKEANIEYSQLGIKKDKIKKFKRLLCNDITSIQFTVKENNKMYRYFVKWSNKNDTQNEYSQTYISELGNCYILIDELKTLEEFVDFDLINDKEFMEIKNNKDFL